MRLKDKTYMEQQDLLESLLTFHPEFLRVLSSSESRSLHAYFAIDADVESFAEHAKRFEAEHPDEVAEALQAGQKILDVAGVRD